MEAVTTSWPRPTYDSEHCNLSPELLLLAKVMRSQNAQTESAKLSVDQAFQRLEELRDKIQAAIERAKEAEENAGLWGDVADAFGGDVATIAGVVLATTEEIADVTLTFHERPYRPADLFAAGAENPDELFLVADEPVGTVHVTVERG